MTYVIAALAGGLLVLAGVAGGWWISTQKPGRTPEKRHDQELKLPVDARDKEFENLMAYNGRPQTRDEYDLTE